MIRGLRFLLWKLSWWFLAQAKSQGYLKNQKSGLSSGKKMLAVIGVYTGFESHLKRNKFRGSWMPRGTPWTETEHKRFLLGLQKIGKGDWKGISSFSGNDHGTRPGASCSR